MSQFHQGCDTTSSLTILTPTHNTWQSRSDRLIPQIGIAWSHPFWIIHFEVLRDLGVLQTWCLELWAFLVIRTMKRFLRNVEVVPCSVHDVNRTTRIWLSGKEVP